MLYHFYERGHTALRPVRMMANSTHLLLKNPFNPAHFTPAGRQTAAALELFERTTRRYEKPTFGITETSIDGKSVRVREKVVWKKPFCKLIHFKRDPATLTQKHDHPVLLVAPMSGHYATLLRGTVKDMLPDHDVYITDWTNARRVSQREGTFDLDDYVDYLVEIFEFFKGHVNVVAVCQSSVPVLAAVSLMEASGNQNVPESMVLMGGPIDTRYNPTAVNKMAVEKDIEWFENNVVMRVPWPLKGHGRKVYPGFIQLSGFMTMNLDRHIEAHRDLFTHLVEGDGESVEKHKEFYDEYLAVMDLTAEFYLQTVESIFIRHTLPEGKMTHRNSLVDPSKIKNVALMTIEGEKDDITGRGQCRAAHDLCSNLAPSRKVHYEQPNVGHYGIFNGSRFRTEIVPRISDFFEKQSAHKFGPATATQAQSLRTNIPANLTRKPSPWRWIWPKKNLA